MQIPRKSAMNKDVRRTEVPGIGWKIWQPVISASRRPPSYSVRVGATSIPRPWLTLMHGFTGFFLLIVAPWLAAGGLARDLHRGCPFHVPRGCFTTRLTLLPPWDLLRSKNDGCFARGNYMLGKIFVDVIGNEAADKWRIVFEGFCNFESRAVVTFRAEIDALLCDIFAAGTFTIISLKG